MTEREATIPAASGDTPEAQIAQLRRWLEGYVDAEGVRHAGLIEMVGELYGELKTKRERNEAIMRGLAIGGVISAISGTLVWLKEHVK